MNNEIRIIGEQLFSMPPGSSNVSVMVFGNGCGGYIKPSEKEKEKEMTDKLKVLQALANVQVDADEFSNLDDTSYNSEIVQAMAELRKEERQKAVKDAARVIIELNTLAQKAIEHHRSVLRKVRQEEKTNIDSIEAIAVAMAYGRETNNFIPLDHAISGSRGKAFLIKQTVADLNNPAKISEEDYDRLLKVIRETQKKAKASSVKKS